MSTDKNREPGQNKPPSDQDGLKETTELPVAARASEVTATPLPPEDLDEIREQLVAYLDGELRKEEADEIERRLVSDASYREELQTLESAWNSLDELPQTKIDHRFADTTLEMVSLAAAEDLRRAQTSAPIERRQRRVRLLTMAFLAALITMVLVRGREAIETARLLRDYHVTDYSDVLGGIERIEFLRRLADLLAADQQHRMLDIDQAEVERFLTLPEKTNSEVRREIESLAPSERTEWTEKVRQFRQRLSESERNQIFGLHAEIMAADDREQLVEAMLFLRNWLQNLTEGQRAELRNATPAERLGKLREWLARNAEIALSEEEIEAIRQRAYEAFKSRMQEGQPRPPMSRDGNRMFFQRFLSPTEMEKILKPKTVEYLKSLTPENRQRQMRQWIRQLFSQIKADNGVDLSARKMAEYFETKLDNDTREHLLTLPREEMMAELEQKMVASELSTRPFLRRRRAMPPDGQFDPPERRRGGTQGRDGERFFPPRPRRGRDDFREPGPPSGRRSPESLGEDSPPPDR